ncbi:DUF6153 family protein [Actinoplanes rectilineatus]|uniref:DUF6153 family protein n=1 Tax=Actinoplanes rectilineatus TaxID=113571 RepID=UPI0012F8C5E5|nr:DUF6153 family protein [Actinoplanes rectilineatus]
MTHRPTTDIRRSARWLLLMGTLFGLAAMHTLGHTGMQMDQPAHHETPVMTSIMGAVQTYLEPTAQMREAPSCTGDHCPGDDGAMSQWSVCLAVLGGLAVFAFLLAVLIGGRRTGTSAAGQAMSPAVASRAPPDKWFGLTIASTAVLRI